MEEIDKKSKIEINIGLDADRVPVKIDWKATDGSAARPTECKAMLVSFFDKKTKETQKIDLWTKDMQVIEMDRFFFQTMRALADTYYKATQNAELATRNATFCAVLWRKDGDYTKAGIA